MNIEKGFFSNLLLLSEDFFLCLFVCGIIQRVGKCRCTFNRNVGVCSIYRRTFIVLWELITIDLCKMLWNKDKNSLLVATEIGNGCVYGNH